MYVYEYLYIYICVCIIYFNIVNHVYIYIDIYEYIDSGINNKIDMKEIYIY